MNSAETLNLLPWLSVARGIVVACGIFLLLRAYDRRSSLTRPGVLVLSLCFAMLALAGAGICAYRVATNLLSPRDWDFLCFWSFGRALALGQSPYNAEVLREIAIPFHPSAEFLSLHYCNYPPVCLPLFWPLGYLSFSAALVVWYAVQISALAASIIILRRYWDESKTRLGLFVTLALVLVLHSTHTTLFYAQSTFLLLLAVLGVIVNVAPVRRGICLGFAMLVKPIAMIFAIDLAMRREWRSLFACCLPPLVALGLFMCAQGVPGLLFYRDRNPLAGNLAFTFFVEPINDSLLAVLLRLSSSPPLAQPVLFAPFVIIAGLLTITTMVVLLRLPQELKLLGLGYVITLALLAYPGTLKHYSILLLIPCSLLWQQRAKLPGGRLTTIATIAFAFGLVWAKWNFAAHLAVWAAQTALFSVASFSFLVTHSSVADTASYAVPPSHPHSPNSRITCQS